MNEMIKSTDLERATPKEMLNPFPLTRELFRIAENELSEYSFNVYTDPSYQKYGQKPLELPEQFAPLVQQFPGKYFIVHYENRLGAYYTSGTRLRQVRLSTSAHRYDSNERLREIDIVEPEASEGRGNIIFFTVSDSINEKDFLDLNTQEGDETSSPHGSAKNTYEIDSNGNKTIKESHFDRLDEALCSWEEEDQPVRWLRNLDIENLGAKGKIRYRDSYLIGRDEKGNTKEQAQIETEIGIEKDEIKSVVIKIGIGALETARVLFEGSDPSIKIVECSPQGMRAFANQMEIVGMDPNYSFIFEQPVNKERVLNFIRTRILMLRDDWDKKQTVFGQNKLYDVNTPLIAD